MNLKLEGKVALITGGASGIGAATAKQFLQSGARVVITGRRRENLTATANRIGALASVADVSTEEGCVQAVNSALKGYGKLDIVVANAGIVREGSLLGEKETDWNETLETNLGGVRRTILAALPSMLGSGGGAIVTISSAAGLRAIPNACSYVTSKSAVIGLTQSLAYDLGPKGIRVNAVCPGWVDSEMSAMEMSQMAEQLNIPIAEAVRRCTQYYPLRRMASPEEVAKSVEFLVSDDASFITGVALPVDGGGNVVDVGTL